MGTIIEDHKSRSLESDISGGSSTRIYTLKGYADENTALNALAVYSPPTVLSGGTTLLRESITITPIVIGTDSTKTMFKGQVAYTASELDNLQPPTEPEEEGLVSSSFNERTEDVTYALDAVHVRWNVGTDNWRYYNSMSRMEEENDPQLQTSPFLYHYNVAINKYAFDQPTLGTQRNVPSATFSISRVIPEEVATNSWFAERFEQVWTLNAFTFRGLAPRTVAFVGMDSQQRIDGSWRVEYNFEFRPYVKGYRISRNGDIFDSKNIPIDHPLKSSQNKGFDFCAWDYLYIRDSTDSTTGDVIVDSFSVCQLYENSNFALLGV
jgi:hypothetical protein